VAKMRQKSSSKRAKGEKAKGQKVDCFAVPLGQCSRSSRAASARKCRQSGGSKEAHERAAHKERQLCSLRRGVFAILRLFLRAAHSICGPPSGLQVGLLRSGRAPRASSELGPPQTLSGAAKSAPTSARSVLFLPFRPAPLGTQAPPHSLRAGPPAHKLAFAHCAPARSRPHPTGGRGSRVRPPPEAAPLGSPLGRFWRERSARNKSPSGGGLVAALRRLLAGSSAEQSPPSARSAPPARPPLLPTLQRLQSFQTG